MPKRNYALHDGGPNRIEVAWRGIFKDVVVTFDGKEILRFADRKALDVGGSYQLEDGATLNVTFKKASFGSSNAGLSVTRDGKPLPGSAGDPNVEARAAAGILFFVATISIAMGVVVLATHASWAVAMGAGWSSIIEGAVFGGLGLIVWFKKSMVALIIATVLYGLDSIIMFAGSVAATVGPSSRTPNIPFMRIFFLIALIRGIGALNKLRKQRVKLDVATARYVSK